MPTSRCRARWTRSSSSRRQELHPARISLPARVCRALSRQAAGSRRSVRAGGLVVSFRQPARRPLRFLVPAHAHRMLGANDDRGGGGADGPLPLRHLRRRSLRVNGGEVAWLAGYQRNFEEAVEVDVAAGRRRRTSSRSGSATSASAIRATISSCRCCRGAGAFGRAARAGRGGAGGGDREGCSPACGSSGRPMAPAKWRCCCPSRFAGFRCSGRGDRRFHLGGEGDGAAQVAARRNSDRARHGRDASVGFPPFRHHADRMASSR